MEATPTPEGQEQRAAELSLLEATVARFTEAFNRFDAAEVASFWTDDGTLINPLGNYGEGRPGIERVFREDAQTILGGTTSRFLIQRVRHLAGCAFLDLEHHVEDFRRPDGSRGPVKLHIAALALKQGDEWRWLDVRPYRFMERPEPLH